MFTGHYAAALALKAKVSDTSLGALFIAVQFTDILFFPFAVAGIEKLEFVENFTAVNNFKMEFYPFTHGLLGSLFWAGLFYLGYRRFGRSTINKKRIALVMGLGVLSHWLADIIVHTPDLPLIYGDPKFGMGLWRSKAATFGVEAVILLAGLWYYLKNTKPAGRFGKYAAILFVSLLIGINYLNIYVLPQENNLESLSISALGSYAFLAGLAFWVDKKREG